MGKHENKHIIKIMSLIQSEVGMGTFGLVELELIEIEKALKNAPQNTAPNTAYTKCPHHCEIPMFNEDTGKEERLHICKVAGHFA